MMYSKKAKLDRRNSIMVTVKKELKAHNAYIAPELLKVLAEALDTSVYYKIEVIRDVEAAAEALRLTDHERAHSWAGGEGFKEVCRAVIFGDVTVGEDYSYEFCSIDGSISQAVSRTDGEFDINEPFAFLRHTEAWSEWNGDLMEEFALFDIGYTEVWNEWGSGCCNFDDKYDTIVIYVPEQVHEEAEYVAMEEAELAELCQLR